MGSSLRSFRFEADVTEEELLACVDKLNKDEDVDGFIRSAPFAKAY